MITVGLVRELQFISRALNSEVKVVFHLPAHLIVSVKNDVLNVWYYIHGKETDGVQHIWSERIDDDSFFGVESCDSIARIMKCIEYGHSWKQYAQQEKVDNIPKPFAYSM